MKDLTNPPRHSKVRQSFRRGLHTYHDAATHQSEIAQRLVSLLSGLALSPINSVFEFGCGTGHLTQSLIAQFHPDKLLLNDLVAECASFAPSHAEFLAGPVQSVTLPSDLDLICSANTVQWLEDPHSTLKTLTSHLRPGGWLALSGFGTSQFHELRSLGSTAFAPSYCDAEEWRNILPSDCKIKHMSQARRVAWFPNAMQLLRHLRDTGVNGASSQNWTTRDLRAFETQYRNRFGTPQGLPLTYDPVWIIAQKT